MNIGFIPITGSFFNALLYRGFSEKYPRAQFKVLELGSLGILAALDADEIDIGYLVLQDEMEEHYDIRRIQRGVLKVLIHKDNPLSSLDKVSIQQLAKEKLINLPNHSYIRRKLNGEFARSGVVPDVLTESQKMLFPYL